MTALSFEPLLPPTDVELMGYYKRARACIWFEDEIAYTSDIPDFESMSDSERHFIELILGFFAVSDRIVLENLVQNFIQEIQVPAAQLFYNFQAVMEDIHSLTYTNHLLTLVKDPVRLDALLGSIEHFTSIRAKAAWAHKWMSRDAPLMQRLVAFAIVEAVFFSASFSAIFWFKTQNKLVRGIGTSNEFISRDERLHADFACALYHHMGGGLSDEVVAEMMREAVECEIAFVRESLPASGFVGMNQELMVTYVKYVADLLVLQLGCKERVFRVDNPFPFMANLAMPGKSNFFEKKVTEYSKIDVSSASALGVLEDF